MYSLFADVGAKSCRKPVLAASACAYDSEPALHQGPAITETAQIGHQTLTKGTGEEGFFL